MTAAQVRKAQYTAVDLWRRGILEDVRVIEIRIRQPHDGDGLSIRARVSPRPDLTITTGAA